MRELWACDRRSQRKTSEGFRRDQRSATILVAGGKVVASRGKGGAVDRSGGCASNDGKRIAVGLNAAYLPNALKDARLIGSTGAAARHA